MSNPIKRINVGSAIRARRKELGMTLKQLAEKSGLSTAYISQVERSNSIPSLMSLYQLTEILDVTVDELIKTSKSFKTYRRGAELEQLPINSDVGYFMLSNPFPNQKIDPLLVKIPGEYEESMLKGEGNKGEAFIYVLQGKLSFSYHGNEFDLETDDSMHYDLEHTLSISNKTKSPAKMLWVGTVIID